MKRMILSIALIFVMPILAFADKIELRVQVPNTNQIFFYRFQEDLSLPDEVHFTNDGGKTWNLLAKGRIDTFYSYSDVAVPKLPDRVKLAKRTGNLAEVFHVRVGIDDRVFLLAKSMTPGSRYILPNKNIGDFNWTNEVSFNGDAYRIISYKTDTEQASVLVRRSDGAKVVLNHVLVTEFKNLQVENGILSVNEFMRKVDLLAFDVEATFAPRGDGQFTDSENKKANAVEFVDRLFEDLLSKGDKPLPLSESDQKTIKSIESNLKREQRGSVVLLGDPGTGKTTLVKEALRGLPRTWRVKILDATSLNSGARHTGVIDMRIESIIKASERLPIIWFADEVHSLRGIGTHSQNSNDVLEYLKKPLADGTVKMIATDTPTEYYEKINDPAIQRRLTAITLHPPTMEELKGKIQAWLSFQKRPAISEEIMMHLIETASDFNATENEPSRSIGLLEAALSQLEDRAPLTVEALNKAAETIYKVDPAIRDVFAMREKLRALPGKLNDIVVGQELVKEPLVTQSKIALANLHDGVGPRLSSFVAGVPGVGKTEIAKAYANAMNLPFRVIEMAQYASGKSGSDLLAEVAEQIRTNAFSVIIFDEIEKAHPKVLESLLTFLSSDRFTSYEEVAGSKRTVKVSSKNCSVIMTSNAGSQKMKDFFERLGETDKERPRKEFANVFSREWIKNAAISAGIPEPLIDRVKAISVALPPNTGELRDILNMHLRRKQSHIQSKMKMDIEFLDIDSYLDDVTKRAKEQNLSNRDVLAELKTYMDERASDTIFHDHYGVEKQFFVNLKTGHITSGSQTIMCSKVFN